MKNEEKEDTTIVKTEDVISGIPNSTPPPRRKRKKYVARLKPTSQMLEALPLKPGRNTITFTVESTWQVCF